MSVSRDIPRAWIRPQTVMAEHMARGSYDDRGFLFLMLGCIMVFVAQLPRLSRQAFETGEDFMLLMGGTLMAWIFVAPLLLIAIAALSHLVAKAIGGKGDWAQARLALGWSLLACTPAFLLHGLTGGFVGTDHPGFSLVGALALGAFFWLWLNSLYVAERPS
ncbi:MAG: YIP1 family protein [Pseudomonadota bacterium]